MPVNCELCGQPSQWLSSKQTAKLLGKAPKTIVRWIKQGRFPGTLKIDGGTTPHMFKIPATAVIPLIREKQARDGTH